MVTNQRGSALIFAMGFMLVVLVVAAGTHHLVLSQLQSSGALRRRVAAEYLAQAGIARATAWFNTQNYKLPQASSLTATVPVKLTSNSNAVVLPSNHPTSYIDALGTSKTNVVASYNSFVTAQATSAGTFTVTASLIDWDPEAWEVLSTGLSGTVQRQVGALLVRQQSSVFSRGLFGANSVALSGAASVDSYDSSQGAYGGSNRFQAGSVASNGDISLAGSSIINGDALPGPSKKVTLSGTSSVTGQTTPASSTVTFPAATVPAAAVNLGAINLTGVAKQTLTAGTYSVSALTIKNSGQLIIDASSGPVNLYVTGAISVAGAGIANASGKPQNLSIAQVGGSNVSFSNSAAFYGTVYAPQSALSIPGNADFFGAFIGASIVISNSGKVHFDQALRTGSGSSGLLKLVAEWTQPS